jgi:hypothetical protein
MRLAPPVLDSRLPCRAARAEDISLLLMPLSQGAVFDYDRTSFRVVTRNPLIFLTTFTPSAACEAAIRKGYRRGPTTADVSRARTK